MCICAPPLFLLANIIVWAGNMCKCKKISLEIKKLRKCVKLKKNIYFVSKNVLHIFKLKSFMEGAGEMYIQHFFM